MYFDSNVNRDGTRKGDIAETVFRIKFEHQLAEFLVFVDFTCTMLNQIAPWGLICQKAAPE